MRNEAITARYLRHPHVVPFLGALRPHYEDPGLQLVTLWMPHGNVHSFCASHPMESKIKYMSESDH
jgi:hypothetical protein